MSQPGSIVTVGSFDGVHRGHRAVLAEIARRAKVLDRQSVLVTFTPHPLAVVNPAAAPPLLTAGDERLEVLAQTGVDRVLMLRFDRRVAAMTPREFVRDILLGRCDMSELVIGHDHGFGRGRSGDAETLRALGAELGFAVDVVGPVDAGGQQVSSSRIRRAVAGGDLQLAARLLGRPYTVHGRVQAGAARGRQLGAPTINLGGIPPEKLLPPDGVYAVRVEWQGGTADGMMNQGGRPTFGEVGRTLEAHLFGVDRNLYGEHVRLAWIGRIRDVRRFDSAEALKEQLMRDRSAAEAILGTHT